MDFIRRAFSRMTGRARPCVDHHTPIVRAASRAAAVRAIAGAPAGLLVARGHRRGTVLVIVLGTLALIAVIAVVYAVVGQADRRASAAFVGSVRREEMPTLVRDYIAGIVGRDALATYRDGAGDIRREAFDYPFTDPYARSVVVGSPGAGSPTVPTSERVAQTFDPAGSFWSTNLVPTLAPAAVRTRLSMGNPLELRVPGDPWLASTQATNLTVADDENVGFPQWDMRDWAHISNVSPDGRFVNLFNLRNNFDSPSGFRLSNPTTGTPEISSRLTLNGPSGASFPVGAPQTLLNPTSPGQLDADPNVPAHWTNDQRGAFVPAHGAMLQPSTDLTPGSPGPISPGDSPWAYPEYGHYQWADADGDGFFDSRWSEFVDISGGLDTPVGIFPPDPTFRWFGAVRIMDLSALVNVNTAGDFLAAPTNPLSTTSTLNGAPGGTPADIDIRRLLAGEDVREMAAGVGYDGLRQPLDTGGNPDPESAQATQPLYIGALPGDPGWVLSQQVGDAAYNHIRYFLEFGLIAPAIRRLEEPAHTDFIEYVNAQHATPLMANGLPIDPATLFRYTRIQDRAEWYETVVKQVPPSGQAGVLSFSEFSIDSEAELRTYLTANDPSMTSALELVADGRFDNGAGAAPDTGSHEYGPFRSPRLATVELGSRDLGEQDATQFASGQPPTGAPDGLPDLDALTQALVDLRQYITTLSAARPLRNAFVSANAATPVPPITSGEQLLTVKSIAASASSLFMQYANALLPYSAIEETWLPVADPNGDQFQTLSYGYDGSELALMHAAHAAVNMADAADGDANPRVATVIVDNDVRDQLNADYDPAPPAGQNPTVTTTLPMAGRQNQWASWADGGAFDLGPNRIADSAAGVGPPVNAAFNVYGAEPQPFIAEVSAVILYTDAPAEADGDTETDMTGLVTIDGALADTSDLAFQAIAFQVTNPFDESINLSGDTDVQESRFYFEWGGRHYRVPEDDANDPTWDGTLDAHETRVFYIAARPFGVDLARWDQISIGSNLVGFINSVMGVLPSTTASGGQGGQPIPLSHFDPLTGADIAPLDYFNVFDVEDVSVPTATVDEVRLWRTALASGQTTGGDPAEEYATNSRVNDVLADRFRVPGTPDNVLRPELNLDNDEVEGATINRNGTVPGPENYDTGLSVLLWGTARRPSDPKARTAATVQEIAWIPAYCLEPKIATGYTPTSHNNAEQDGVPRTGLDLTGFISGGKELNNTFAGIIANAGGVVDTLVQYPVDKTKNDIGTNIQTQPWDQLITEFHHDVGGGNARPLAPADLLIAKGIGASLQIDSTLNYDPGVLADLDKWTTLGEATMLALDYGRGTAGTHVMWGPGRPRTNGATSGLVERGSLELGHLVIDEYVSYLDVNPGPAPTFFDPDEDIAYGDAQPLALGIMAQARILEDEYGTFRRATPGLVNINTAPLAVLRTLAMLSPTHGLDPANPSLGPGGAWQAFTNNNTETTGQGMTSDGASMLQAYRDLITVYPRGDQTGAAPPTGQDIIDFETNGRAVTAGIGGVREVPGFRSIAEVVNARNYALQVVGTGASRVPNLHDLDRLGFDTVSGVAGGPPIEVNQLGFDPMSSAASPVDALGNEFDERLVLANAIAGSISVRSDVYAVWFVLHGYRESDCTGLSDSLQEADPLIPSVSRRFLMILDRSGVVNPGDKPAILLFREVPYNPTLAGDGSAI